MKFIQTKLKQIKYTLQAIALFKREILPIIINYIKQTLIFLNDIKITENLEEKIKNDRSITKKQNSTRLFTKSENSPAKKRI